MSHSLQQISDYANLVRSRKDCRLCEGDLVNPSHCSGGTYDGEEIGPWSRWQGGLTAPLLVVGQDWGDVRTFIRQAGTSRADNPTNRTLIQLIREAGVEIAPPDATTKGQAAFFTNAILCLKTKGGLQGSVERRWFDRCGSKFLLPLIRLIHPRVVVTLGERAFRVLESLYELPHKSFTAAVEQFDGFSLGNGTRLFPMYHCGRRILNTHRHLEQQKADWRRLGAFLAEPRP